MEYQDGSVPLVQSDVNQLDAAKAPVQCSGMAWRWRICGDVDGNDGGSGGADAMALVIGMVW